MAPWVPAAIAAGGSILGGILGRPKGTAGQQYPREYRDILRFISNYMSSQLGAGGFKGPGFDINVPMTGLTRQALGNLQQFGASGYKPFLQTLQSVAAGTDAASVYGAYDKLASISADTLGKNVNQRFGTAGFIKGSDRFRALADIVAKTRLSAQTAKADFTLREGATRTAAAQLGLTLTPQLFGMVAQAGMLERGINVDNLMRRLNLFTKLSVEAPIALIGAARGAAQPMQQGIPVSGMQAFGMALPGAVNTGLSTYLMMQYLNNTNNNSGSQTSTTQ